MSRIVRSKGFTIVELLIVIVVIAILAAISIVAYNGIQQRAHDTRRVSDITTIAKAMQRWSIEEGQDFSGIPAGYGSIAANGWYNTNYSTNSLKGVLVGKGYINTSVDDPIDSKGAPARAYMVAPCIDGNDKIRILLANMETAQSQTVAQQIGSPACTSSTFTGFVNGYGMDYGKRVTVE